ncbi:alanine racemase [Alkalilacustris brevis]|uniref:alanine racemase n=1 Tax=Alkalilacustris brevis TaxID=2026338 RepID=UPI000E0DF85A|nr:alanine racemase [Alkalilacustris brevis]
MAQAQLFIDLDALARNWTALDSFSAAGVETAATVKANGYGLGIAPVARTLAAAGARKFFTAIAEEGVMLRDILGPGPEIFVYSGHMPGDAGLIAGKDLVPMLNSVEQLTRHFEALPDHPFGIQLDSGMNRLGMEPAEWAAVAELALPRGPRLLQSHLACADEPDHPMNARQLAIFRDVTDGLGIPRSIAATGGVLLGPEYHFELTRPGIGLYGGAPFAQANPVTRLSIPVIQTRELEPEEAVGYGCTWTAEAPARIATLAAGYADGILRALSNRIALYSDDTPCPLRGRVSMDLLTVDVSHLDEVPETLDLLGPQQGVDVLADAAGTIGYEILTALGARYARQYMGGTQ